MAVTLRQLAALVQGKVVGDGDLVVQSARVLHEAQAGDITFLDNARHAAKLTESKASAAVVHRNLPASGKAVIQVDDPLSAFIIVLQHLRGITPPAPIGIHPRAEVHASAQIGADPSIHLFAIVGENTVIGQRCRLHAGVVIGSNCRLGDDVVLHPNVVLYDGTVIGDRVIIHANSTIGADGFGYRFQGGRHVKVPQIGNVVVGNDVEMGANSAIDRGTFGSTTIGEGTKLDNLVQIAHNCRIGKHNALAAQVGIGGSTTTGNYVFMGGQSGAKDHVTVGDGVMLGCKTGVIQDVPAGTHMFLYPAQEEHLAHRIQACLKKLPSMRKDLLRVLKELNLKETDMQPVRSPEAPAA